MSFTRDIIDETIANGFSNKTYKAQYEFYFHILAQCKVILSTDIETAGVIFSKTKYILTVNPEFFNPLPLTQRLGILKHEMLHILFNHVGRFPSEKRSVKSLINEKLKELGDDEIIELKKHKFKNVKEMWNYLRYK